MLPWIDLSFAAIVNLTLSSTCVIFDLIPVITLFTAVTDAISTALRATVRTTERVRAVTVLLASTPRIGTWLRGDFGRVATITGLACGDPSITAAVRTESAQVDGDAIAR